VRRGPRRVVVVTELEMVRAGLVVGDVSRVVEVVAGAPTVVVVASVEDVLVDELDEELDELLEDEVVVESKVT